MYFIFIFSLIGLINTQTPRTKICGPKWTSPIRDYGNFFKKENFRPGSYNYAENKSPSLAYKKCFSRPSTRVMHGDEAIELDIAKMPWMAQIYKNLKKPLLCSGSIIGARRVLTTAWCTNQFEVIHDVKVVLGSSLATGKKGRETDWTVVSVQQVYKHRDYNYDNEFNIAIIETSELRFTTKIRPIRLWAPLRHGETIVIAGFGKQNRRGRRLHLTCTNLMIHKLETCKEQIPTIYWPEMQSHTLCASGIDSLVGACEGDQGGGIFKKINHEIRQYGIISTPNHCLENSTPDVIIIFTPKLEEFFLKYGGPDGELHIHG